MKKNAPYIVLISGLLLLLASDHYLSGRTFGVRTETLQIANVKQILPLSDRYVRPVLYTHVNGLSALPTHEAKKAFIHAVLPAVLVARHEMNMTIRQLKLLARKTDWNSDDSLFYETAAHRFKAKNMQELLASVGTVPNSVVLAQAAVESGWGQSRIFLEGNNLFGIWSFDANEPRIAAGETRGKRTIWLRSYNNMSESIVSYFEILSTSRAFKSLRAARAATSDPMSLLPHLRNFSERRSAYTRQLKTMIQQNNLTQYDSYELDPEYIFEK